MNQGIPEAPVRRRNCNFKQAKFAQEHTGPFTPLVRNKKVVDWRCACGIFNSDVEGDFPVIANFARYQAAKKKYAEKEAEREKIMKIAREDYAKEIPAKKEAPSERKRMRDGTFPSPEEQRRQAEQAARDTARSAKLRTWKIPKNKKHAGGRTQNARAAKRKKMQKVIGGVCTASSSSGEFVKDFTFSI